MIASRAALGSKACHAGPVEQTFFWTVGHSETWECTRQICFLLFLRTGGTCLLVSLAIDVEGMVRRTVPCKILLSPCSQICKKKRTTFSKLIYMYDSTQVLLFDGVGVLLVTSNSYLDSCPVFDRRVRWQNPAISTTP